METRSTKPEKVKDTDVEKSSISKTDDEDPFDSDDSFPEIECDLCCKEFSSVKMYEQHVNSKKHQQMLSKRKVKQKIGKFVTENGQISNTNGDDTHIEADDSADELSCEICCKSFSGYIPYVSHLKSNVHSKNLKRHNLKEQMKDLPGVIKNDPGNENDEDDILQKPFAHCTPCSKVFYDPKAFQQHMKGSQHKKKMQGQKTFQTLKSQLAADSEKLDDDLFGKCDVCDKSFSGPVPYKIHLQCAAHKKEVKRAQIEDSLKEFFTKEEESQKLVCKECQKMFTDPFALKSHLESNSHEKQKAKDVVFDFVASYPEIVAVKTIKNLSSDDESEEGNYRNGFYFFVCKLCHLSFSGPENVRDHVQSKKHIQVKKEKRDRKSLRRKIKEEQELSKNNGLTKSEPGNSSDNIDAPVIPTVETSAGLSKKLNSESEINDEFEFI